MKVMLVNGSPHEHGCTDAALREVASALNADGIDTEIFWIGNTPIGGCIACGGCDPALDNSVTLYEMLYDKGFTCELKVYEGIMHAFLHYSRMLDMAYDAMQDGADFMARARIIKRGK